MSSRRYQEDIRRIVGMPDVVGGLDDDLPRTRIDGARGIFMIGSGETKSGAAPGEDEDGNATDPEMPDENEDNQNEDGGGDGGGGTDTDATNPDDFIIDPEDPGNYSPDDTTFGDGWGSGGVSTFQDCVDDKCIEIVERGGYVPPEGWDSADEPGLDPSWSPDGIWQVQGYSGVGCTLSEAFANAPSSLNFSAGDCSWSLSSKSLNGNTITWSGTYPACHPSAGQPHTSSASIIFSEFGGAACSDPVYAEYWPSDDCIQLAPNEDGQWAASEYENPNDMTAKYSEPKSILDLCTPNGDGVQILPGVDGGTVRWNYTQGRFMAISPDGRRSFGGATEITTAVAGSVSGGGAIKAVGAAVPSG